MSTSLPLNEAEFATIEEAAAYDLWLRTKVQASLGDRRPLAAHDDVMAALRNVIEVKRDGYDGPTPVTD